LTFKPRPPLLLRCSQASQCTRPTCYFRSFRVRAKSPLVLDWDSLESVRISWSYLGSLSRAVFTRDTTEALTLMPTSRAARCVRLLPSGNRSMRPRLRWKGCLCAGAVGCQSCAENLVFGTPQMQRVLLRSRSHFRARRGSNNSTIIRLSQRILHAGEKSAI
jgi:hypothetical protein